MTQVKDGRSLFGLIVAWGVALWTTAGENVRRASTGLTGVNRMRPGVGERTSQPVRQALVQLNGKAVVIAVETGIDNVDTVIARVHTVLAHVKRSGIGTH